MSLVELVTYSGPDYVISIMRTSGSSFNPTPLAHANNAEAGPTPANILQTGSLSGLNQEGCIQRLQLEFGDKSQCLVTEIRRLKEFLSGPNSLQDAEHTGRLRPAKELNFGSAATYKIIREELRMKRVVCFWVPYNRTEHKKEERVRISKKNPLKCQMIVATALFLKL
ncbi:UNVERIFIED_CONTAM: hypothetical protein NCL1_36572 [Trichonephila clavipes]